MGRKLLACRKILLGDFTNPGELQVLSCQRGATLVDLANAPVFEDESIADTVVADMETIAHVPPSPIRQHPEWRMLTMHRRDEFSGK